VAEQAELERERKREGARKELRTTFSRYKQNLQKT
jgi:hypothetical protein